MKKLMPFGVVVLLWAAAWALALCSVGNQELFWRINQQSWPAADAILPWLTHLGDGLAMVAVAVLLAAMGRWRQGLLVAAAYAVSGLAAQGLKRQVWPDALRPKAFFEQKGIAIRAIEGVEQYSYHSFPSGHATSAFCLATLLAFLFPRVGVQLGTGVLAALVAFSRVYIGQHFPIDILAGTILGVVSAFFIHQVYISTKWSHGTNHLPSAARQG